MKKCPQCAREYDASMSFCLDDGTELLYGPASMDEPATAVFGVPPSGGPADEGKTQLLDVQDTNDPPSFGVPKSDIPNAGLDKRLVVASVVLAVIVLGGFFGYRYFASSSKQIDSIAVMPFANESGNPDIEYLSDGMTETLIRTLSQLPNLYVKSRSSVFRYKGKPTDLKTIANELGVRAILSGRVIQRGDGLILSLELIDTETENVLWAEQYDRKSSHLVSLQNEIARDVSTKLKLKLSGDDEQRLAKSGTNDPDAYKQYLQGRFYWNKRDENSFRKATEHFNQAIAIDPNYALAYAALADTYALMATFGFVAPSEGMPKAQEYARKAMSLDDSLAEPHTALAVTLQSYEYDFVAAEKEYRRAIELNPNYLTGHQWYGEMLVCAGRFDEAAAEYRRALEIDPLSLPANWEYARLSYFAREFDESIALHEKLIRMDAAFQGTYRTIAEAYRVKGEFEKAAEAHARFFELGGEPQKAVLTRTAFAKDGWKGVLKLMTAEPRPLQLRHTVVARAYVELGDRDKAFEELNRSFEKREAPLQWLRVEPQFDPLRDDPRFKDLLRRMKLPEK